MEIYDVQPGFRFYPTEEELVDFYLRNKLDGKREQHIQRVIPTIDIYLHNPWELPKMAAEGIRDDLEQLFFFIPMQDNEARGGRPTRLTTAGYWKATGSPGYVYSSNNRIIGGKRTMVFYMGRAPNGKKTLWKMNEYRATIVDEASLTNTITNLKLRHEFSLCRVYKKSKCARSFDRRPTGFEGIPLQPLIAGGDQAAQSNQNVPLVESSSSGERHGGTSQPKESVEGLDLWENPAWEWECLYLED